MDNLEDISGTDLNEFNKTGFFIGTNLKNAPTPTITTVKHMNVGNSKIQVIGTLLELKQLFGRFKYDNVNWVEWQEIHNYMSWLWNVPIKYY